MGVGADMWMVWVVEVQACVCVFPRESKCRYVYVKGL